MEAVAKITLAMMYNRKVRKLMATSTNQQFKKCKRRLKYLKSLWWLGLKENNLLWQNPIWSLQWWGGGVWPPLHRAPEQCQHTTIWQQYYEKFNLFVFTSDYQLFSLILIQQCCEKAEKLSDATNSNQPVQLGKVQSDVFSLHQSHFIRATVRYFMFCKIIPFTKTYLHR